jgi:hypothetical protein
MLLLLTLLATHKDAVLPEALAKCEACRVMVESVHTNVDDYLTQNENGKGPIRFRSVARSPHPPARRRPTRRRPESCSHEPGSGDMQTTLRSES